MFSWKQKPMFSCWVDQTRSLAVKYVKKYEIFEETSLMWGYGLRSTLEIWLGLYKFSIYDLLKSF